MVQIKSVYFIIIFTLLSLLARPTFGAISKEVSLVGKVIKFDEKNVGIKSGDLIFNFSKSRLKFHSYKINQKIRVSMTWKELTQLKSKPSKRKKRY